MPDPVPRRSEKKAAPEKGEESHPEAKKPLRDRSKPSGGDDENNGQERFPIE